MDQGLVPLLRRRDPDRYFTALFAPPAPRPALFALYAFNAELARAREVAREPGLALIRLQWWREVVEGAARGHEVATPLCAALAEGALHAEPLLAMIEAREREVAAEFDTLADWLDWLGQGPGSLAVAAGRALGAPPGAEPRLRALGAGYGVSGHLRSIVAFARAGHCALPAALLTAHGLTPGALVAAPAAPAVAPLRAALAAIGTGLLGRAAPCNRAWVAAALPATLARRDLARPHAGAAPRTLADRLAVVVAASTGRA
jgi:phytoene synthase